MQLTSGINIITGQNNAGKTSFLEAMATGHTYVPHRSLKSLWNREVIPVEASTFETEVTLSGSELLALFAGERAIVPLPALPFRECGWTGPNYEASSLQAFTDWLFSRPACVLKIVQTRAPGSGAAMHSISPTFSLYEPGAQGVSVLLTKTGATPNAVLNYAPNQFPQLCNVIATRVNDRIYRFAAERFNVGVCAAGGNAALHPNASNLPEVLDVLQGSGPIFERFNEAVRSILPQVACITIAPQDAARKILIWSNAAYGQQREDLAVGLNDCGTGIGQVLAILYVTLGAKNAQVILIDEPQSFLHPGAARKLIETLKLYPQHQYIVSTHSPTIISAAEPSAIVVIKHDGHESLPQAIDTRDLIQLRTCFADIGVSLADVFGADGILWVEGPTEERCYPLIVSRLLKHPLMGKIVKSVVATGDFDGKHAERFLEMYSRLSGAQYLIPPAIAFLFDDEGRSEAEKHTLRSRGKGLVHFTKRRMYENYLLDAAAISHVINSSGTTNKVQIEQVQELLESLSEEKVTFIQ